MLHAADWDDRFGNQRSVGCVNLSPEDARWVFGWALPAIPTGWLEVQAGEDQGSVVRIHSHADLHPKWIDFDGEPVADSRHR